MLFYKKGCLKMLYWDDKDLHNQNEQIKRQQSALTVRIDFINYEEQVGKINDYNVTLNFCECGDFIRRHRPCKHMYRLAHELNIFKLEGRIKNDAFNNRELDERKKASKKYLSKLPENVIDFLYDLAWYGSIKGRHLYDKNIVDVPYVKDLIDNNIIEVSPISYIDYLSTLKINELKALITTIRPSKMNAKQPIIDCLVSNYKETLDSIIDSFSQNHIILKVSDASGLTYTALARFISPLRSDEAKYEQYMDW